jgi:hypothetical protein
MRHKKGAVGRVERADSIRIQGGGRGVASERGRGQGFRVKDAIAKIGPALSEARQAWGGGAWIWQ